MFDNVDRRIRVIVSKVCLALAGILVAFTILFNGIYFGINAPTTKIDSLTIALSVLVPLLSSFCLFTTGQLAHIDTLKETCNKLSSIDGRYLERDYINNTMAKAVINAVEAKKRDNELDDLLIKFEEKIKEIESEKKVNEKDK